MMAESQLAHAVSSSSDADDSDSDGDECGQGPVAGTRGRVRQQQQRQPGVESAGGMAGGTPHRWRALISPAGACVASSVANGAQPGWQAGDAAVGAAAAAAAAADLYTSSNQAVHTPAHAHAPQPAAVHGRGGGDAVAAAPAASHWQGRAQGAAGGARSHDHDALAALEGSSLHHGSTLAPGAAGAAWAPAVASPSGAVGASTQNPGLPAAQPQLSATTPERQRRRQGRLGAGMSVTEHVGDNNTLITPSQLQQALARQHSSLSAGSRGGGAAGAKRRRGRDRGSHEPAEAEMEAGGKDDPQAAVMSDIVGAGVHLGIPTGLGWAGALGGHEGQGGRVGGGVGGGGVPPAPQPSLCSNMGGGGQQGALGGGVAHVHVLCAPPPPGAHPGPGQPPAAQVMQEALAADASTLGGRCSSTPGPAEAEIRVGGEGEGEGEERDGETVVPRAPSHSACWGAHTSRGVGDVGGEGAGPSAPAPAPAPHPHRPQQQQQTPNAAAVHQALWRGGSGWGQTPRQPALATPGGGGGGRGVGATGEEGVCGSCGGTAPPTPSSSAAPAQAQVTALTAGRDEVSTACIRSGHLPQAHNPGQGCGGVPNNNNGNGNGNNGRGHTEPQGDPGAASVLGVCVGSSLRGGRQPEGGGASVPPVTGAPYAGVDPRLRQPDHSQFTAQASSAWAPQQPAAAAASAWPPAHGEAAGGPDPVGVAYAGPCQGGVPDLAMGDGAAGEAGLGPGPSGGGRAQGGRSMRGGRGGDAGGGGGEGCEGSSAECGGQLCGGAVVPASGLGAQLNSSAPQRVEASVHAAGAGQAGMGAGPSSPAVGTGAGGFTASSTARGDVSEAGSGRRRLQKRKRNDDEDGGVE